MIELIDDAGAKMILQDLGASTAVFHLPASAGMSKAVVPHACQAVLDRAIAAGWHLAPAAPDVAAQREAQRRADMAYVPQVRPQVQAEPKRPPVAASTPRRDAFDLTSLPAPASF